MILAILNLHVAPMPPTKVWLIPTYHLGADVVWRFTWWPPWRPPWMSEQNDFGNPEFLCCSDASHQISAPSHLRFRRRCLLKNSKMTTLAAILKIATKRFRNSKFSCLSNATRQVIAKSDFPFGSRCRLKSFKITATHPSWLSERF